MNSTPCNRTEVHFVTDLCVCNRTEVHFVTDLCVCVECIKIKININKNKISRYMSCDVLR